MTNEVIGGLIGALITAMGAVLVGWLALRGKRVEVDADVKIRPQLAFYEDLMSRVTQLEAAMAATSKERDDMAKQLADALARCQILEERVRVLDEALVRRDVKIDGLRQQRNHYRRLALMGSEEIRLSGLGEISEQLADAISDADEASSITNDEEL